MNGLLPCTIPYTLSRVTGHVPLALVIAKFAWVEPSMDYVEHTAFRKSRLTEGILFENAIE